MSPILVVQHEGDCPPAWFGTWMTEAGAVLDVRRPYAGEDLPADLTGHSGMVVLGGSMNALDESATPWLAPVKALVREAVGARVPMLGICLGHQIATDALGGQVVRNRAGTQRGLLIIGWNNAVAGDPVFGTRPLAAAHWNSDIAHVPPDGATVLARAESGEIQVLRFGETAWGIQSHPEVDERVLQAWAEQEWAEVGTDNQAEVDDFLTRVVDEWDSLVAWWQPVAAAFAALCLAAPAQP